MALRENRRVDRGPSCPEEGESRVGPIRLRILHLWGEGGNKSGNQAFGETRIGIIDYLWENSSIGKSLEMIAPEGWETEVTWIHIKPRRGILCAPRLDKKGVDIG